MVGDWLGDARENDVFEHAGARDVIRREDFAKTGATTMREVLNRIPGVSAPENNGTGSHDLAMNFGIRGLNPRLASRSTVLMDGIPVPFAPYGQPQLSLAPVSLGNMDAIDVVRGGGAVRYGPQSVGGVVNFVTRAIPQDFGIEAGVEGQLSPTSSQNNPKETHNLMVGGTADNGFGTALLYSGTRGSDWREHSATRIDDLMLKSKYAPNEVHTFNSLLQSTGFVMSVYNDHHFFCRKYRTDSNCQRSLWNLIDVIVEETGISNDSIHRQCFLTSAGSQ